MDSAQVESALRPRDIQARIRAGESAEAVAEIAQVPVDRVMAYAVPVMAERQHIADRAQRSAVRRKHVDGPAMQLWDAVAERLRSERVAPESTQWDAWRREDGRWTVTVRYRGEQGERTGTFVFDALSRYAVADDDEGRRLVGERGEEHAERSRSKGSASGRRLAAVASEYDAMLFDDDEPTTDLTAVADVLGDHEEPEQERPRREAEPEVAEDDREEPVARTTDDDAPRARQQPKPEKRGRRGRGRASVPSWDEIMFGQPKG